MKIEQNQIDAINSDLFAGHKKKLDAITANYEKDFIDTVIQKIQDFQVAIPSWALGTGGTRFGRFPGGGEPSTLEQKLDDIALMNKLTRSGNAVSLHIPWDNPKNLDDLNRWAKERDLHFDAMNSNTFQDAADKSYQPLSYKFGSLQNVDDKIRKQAIAHNIEVIKMGAAIGSNALTVWLADGSCFPGQLNFRGAWQRTFESLQEIYAALPDDMKLYLEYKAFEPNFYSTTVGDWGQSYLYTSKLGEKAYTLVDLGHHLPNANIEQIVALLLHEKKLAGFHFNDSKYGDDDLTVGCINPYQLYLIFHELVEGMDARKMDHVHDLGWMIDASHNVKDPLEDLLESVEAIKIAYAQALLIDQKQLDAAQNSNDVVKAQELLQDAYRVDVRPLVSEARLRTGGAINLVDAYRKLDVRKNLIKERGENSVATGL